MDNSDFARYFTSRTRTRLGTKNGAAFTYSDAYEVYGLTRTGCCGCPISSKTVDDLELIRPYEPNVVKAAWNIFGKSYEYRAKYNEYKERRKFEEKEKKNAENFSEHKGNAAR